MRILKLLTIGIISLLTISPITPILATDLTTNTDESLDCYLPGCSDFDYYTCLDYPDNCAYIDFKGCVDKRDLGELSNLEYDWRHSAFACCPAAIKGGLECGLDPLCILLEIIKNKCPQKCEADLCHNVPSTCNHRLEEEVDCDNLDREQCSKHPKECIYIGCSYGCPGCTFRNETNVLGSIQSSIQHATSDYWGRSTSSGPDGGVEACAWAVNNIISDAGYRKVGDNPDYVPSVVDALKGGRGRQIQASQAVPGDLVVACGEQHIGVCMEANCNTIDSNSSSRRCFCWRSGFNFDNYFGCGPATYWRVEN